MDSRLQSIAEDAVLSTVRDDQQRLNKRLYKNREEFENLAYLTIYEEDSIKMMLSGEGKLYKDLRDKLLVQCAFVALDPNTGGILAMVGGRPDYHDQYNRAVQARRQPGSVFKPFVYTTALDNGYPVTEQLLNQPVVLNIQNMDGTWVKWKPQNYDGSTGGLTTLREGLRKSMNLISVRMVQQDIAPAEQVKQTAKRMGINTDIRAVDALALGTSEVSLIELTSAYAGILNKGVSIKPFGLKELSLKGDSFPIIEHKVYLGNQAISEGASEALVYMLNQVIEKGTGVRAKIKDWGLAGKTGTTNKNYDAWFIGFSSNLVIGVYVGYDNPETLGRYETGSKAALPIFKEFIKNSLFKEDFKEFEIPEGIYLTSLNYNTGLKASFGEKDTIIEALKARDINNIDNNELISINSYDKLIKYRQFY